MRSQYETRMKIVDGMYPLVLSQDIDKIKVVDICKRSGVSRATFYRSFYDAIDVVHWLWDELNTESLYLMGNPLGWRVAHIRQFSLLSEYRAFFERAFRSREYFSVSEYGGQKILQALMYNICEVKGYTMTDQEKFELEYYVCGCTHMFAKWGREGMKQSPEEMTDLFGRLIPPFVKNLCGE